VLLALAFVPALRNNGVEFDPIDADDFAVMKQSTGEQYMNLQKAAQQEETVSDLQSKHDKRVKLKHTSFQLALNIHDKSCLNIFNIDREHMALEANHYLHLFYRDIKPPPRLV
jgi:hypothetical protein